MKSRNRLLKKNIGINTQTCVLIPIFCIIMVIFSLFNMFIVTNISRDFGNHYVANYEETEKLKKTIDSGELLQTINSNDSIAKDTSNFENFNSTTFNNNTNSIFNNCANCSAMQNASKKMEIISSFSTSYKDSPEERKYNIRLALKSLDGKSVMPGEEMSFNKVVGLRTEERGYKKALVIFKGSYTEGVGGGVCQVSSTLYNAWLLGGLDVISATAHSLPPSYVELSRDATVSEYIDLVLRNPTDTEVYLSTNYDEEKITINLLGRKRDCEYKLQSETIKVIPYEEDIIELEEEGENEFFIGKDGYISRLILSIEKGGRTLAKKEIRRDYYKPQNGVKILRKSIVN